MAIRSPAVAGQFYEAGAAACRRHLEQMVNEVALPAELPAPISAAVVPHAGWVFSGPLAALAFQAIHQQNQAVDTFVVFGAAHRRMGRHAAVYDRGGWQTPLGEIAIDEALTAAILADNDDLLRADQQAHAAEHAIEVQVPLIQHLFPQAALAPIMVPPTDDADEVGRRVARALAAQEKRVVCIASTDLTHYGPSYGFIPMGVGPGAIEWAKETNDRYFIDMVCALRADTLVESAEMYQNACGAGAVAAAVAAAVDLGATRAQLLAHTTSAEIMARRFRQASQDSVGYAAIVMG